MLNPLVWLMLEENFKVINKIGCKVFLFISYDLNGIVFCSVSTFIYTARRIFRYIYV